MKQPYKVYALRPGVRGYDARGNPLEIRPGTRAFMEKEDAEKAERAGDVDICFGRTTASLRPVSYETRVEQPEPDPEMDVEKDEVAPAKAAPRPPRRPAKRRYKRTDMTAESP